jgi:hypothetical protein
MEKVKEVALIVVQVQEGVGVAMEVMVAMVIMQTTMEDVSIMIAVVEG